MANVVIHERGSSLPTAITRMFFTQGPHMLGSRRFDHLVSATVVRDASTISAVGKTEGTATTSVASQIVRSAAGYAVAGPLGAIVGGSGGKQNISTNTVTDQKTNTDIYMHLHFKAEAGPISVQVKDENAFQIIQSYVGGTEWTEVQLNEARSLSYAGQASPNIKLAELRLDRNSKLKAERYSLISGIVVISAFTIYAFYGFTQSNSWFIFKFIYMMLVVVLGGGGVTWVVTKIIHAVMLANNSRAAKTVSHTGEPASIDSTGTLKKRKWSLIGIAGLLLLVAFGISYKNRSDAHEKVCKELNQKVHACLIQDVPASAAYLCVVKVPDPEKCALDGATTAALKALEDKANAKPLYDPVEKYGKAKVDAAQKVMALARQGDRIIDNETSLRVEMATYIADRNQLFGYISAIANSDVVLHGKARNIYFYDPSQKKIAQADALSGVRLID